MNAPAPPPNRSILSFFLSIPIAILGGLMALGGAEFRLPMLVGPLKYARRQAIALNLTVSLVTVTASLIIRGNTIALDRLIPRTVSILALIVGAVVATFFGTRLAGRISDRGSQPGKRLKYEKPRRTDCSRVEPRSLSASGVLRSQSDSTVVE